MVTIPVTVRVGAVDTIEHPDNDGDLSYLEQDCFNEETDTEPAGYGMRRIAAYGEEWWFVGLEVRATIELTREDGTILSHDHRDAALWGIESDCGEEYRAQVIGELREELAHMIREEFGSDIEGLDNVTGPAWGVPAH